MRVGVDFSHIGEVTERKRQARSRTMPTMRDEMRLETVWDSEIRFPERKVVKLRVNLDRNTSIL